MGAKSRNLANLRGKLPDWVKLPPAVTVPFGSFEQVGGAGRRGRGGQQRAAAGSLAAAVWQLMSKQPSAAQLLNLPSALRI